MKRYLSLVIAIAMLIGSALACGADDSPAQDGSGDGTPMPKAMAMLWPTTTPGPTVDVSDCTLGATYQADVTIPDDTEIEIGQSFVKTWRIRNTGTCDWGAGYRFAFVDGDPMRGPDAVGVPEMAAGESVEISVELIAPAEGGRHRAYWQVCVNEGDCFGDRVYVQIVAFDPSKPTPTSPPVVPTQPPAAQPTAAPVCVCTHDAYNCSSFSRQSQAQGCYNYCREMRRGDVHRLDNDKDGRVCESLP
jgi:hypothetical protein